MRQIIRIAALLVAVGFSVPAQAAFVQLSVDQSQVVGVFARPQNDPTPPGYAVIADSDPRLATFLQSQSVANQVAAAARATTRANNIAKAKAMIAAGQIADGVTLLVQQGAE